MPWAASLMYCAQMQNSCSQWQWQHRLCRGDSVYSSTSFECNWGVVMTRHSLTLGSNDSTNCAISTRNCKDGCLLYHQNCLGPHIKKIENITHIESTHLQLHTSTLFKRDIHQHVLYVWCSSLPYPGPEERQPPEKIQGFFSGTPLVVSVKVTGRKNWN